jgi:hypothetical protein
MEISKDKSLIIVIDNKQYSFKPTRQIYYRNPMKKCQFNKSNVTRNYPSGIVSDEVCFATSPDIIEKIINAQKVKVIVLGTDDSFEEKYFTSFYFEYFKYFLDYVYEKVETKK